MKSLLEQEGLATQIFQKAGCSVQRARDFTDDFIGRQPKISNPSGVYLDRALISFLIARRRRANSLAMSLFPLST